MTKGHYRTITVTVMHIRVRQLVLNPILSMEDVITNINLFSQFFHPTVSVGNVQPFYSSQTSSLHYVVIMKSRQVELCVVYSRDVHIRSSRAAVLQVLDVSCFDTPDSD